MKRTRLAEEQIIGILKEAEAGAKGGGYGAAAQYHRQVAQLDLVSPAGPGKGNAAICRGRRFHREQSLQTCLR